MPSFPDPAALLSYGKTFSISGFKHELPNVEPGSCN